jgi:Fibronectin type III domain
VSAAGWVNYRVYQRNITAGQTTFVVSPTAVVDTTAARVSNLVNGERYAFRVTAFNGGGEGPPSNVVEATAIVPPPSAPTNLTATANLDGTIGLTWTTSGPDIWYWIYVRNVTMNEPLFTRLQYPVTSGTSFTAAYLNVGHTYAFYVTAIGSNSESPPSNITQATSQVAPPPAPTNLTAVSRPDGTIGLSWTSSGPGV